MATIGLDKLYYSKITEDASGNETYANPVLAVCFLRAKSDSHRIAAVFGCGYKYAVIKYEMLLTTKATKEIAGRYGGLENLGDKLMKSENFEMALDEIVWLITLL